MDSSNDCDKSWLEDSVHHLRDSHLFQGEVGKIIDPNPHDNSPEMSKKVTMMIEVVKYDQMDPPEEAQTLEAHHEAHYEGEKFC